MTDDYEPEDGPFFGAGTDVDDASAEPAARRGHTRRHRSVLSLVVVLVVLALLVVGGIFLVTAGIGKLEDAFAGPEDYSGDGTGSVTVQVAPGDTAGDIARSLQEAGVVESVEAFTEAAAADDRSRSIQAGYYELHEKMSADSALALLIDSDNLVQATVTVPEGARVRQIVDAVVAKTDITKAALTKALANPRALDLPAAAEGNPEGYLFPATYTVAPDATALSLLRQMVDKSTQVIADLDVAQDARRLGLSVEQALTVASILEYEANRTEDYPKVARVIYNRIDQGMPLQLDSTVSYVSGREGDVWTTASEREDDSLYNTYQHTGLPPGPIGSPGEETIRAALHPAAGNWLYFVPDFENGTTLFTDDYQQHLRNAERAKEYCRTHDEC